MKRTLGEILEECNYQIGTYIDQHLKIHVKPFNPHIDKLYEKMKSLTSEEFYKLSDDYKNFYQWMTQLNNDLKEYDTTPTVSDVALARQEIASLPKKAKEHFSQFGYDIVWASMTEEQKIEVKNKLSSAEDLTQLKTDVQRKKENMAKKFGGFENEK